MPRQRSDTPGPLVSRREVRRGRALASWLRLRPLIAALLALGFVLSASCSAASADSWQALVTGDALFGGSGAGGAGFDFGSSLATGFVGVSSGPAGDVAVSPDGQTGFVMFSGGVQEVDMATSPISAGPVISLTDGANGGVVSPNGDTLYVTDYADGLVIPIDLTQTPAAVDTSDEVSVGTDPYDVAISPDGDTLYVANQGSGNVSVVDLETSPLTVTHTITVGSWPMGMALSPNGSKLYVSNGHDCSISVIDTATNAVTGTITLGSSVCAQPSAEHVDYFYGDPAEVALTPDGSTLYAASPVKQMVVPIPTATHTPGTAISFTSVTAQSEPFTPDALGFTPDGSELLVSDDYADPSSGSCPCGNSVQVVATPANTLSGSPITLGDPYGALIDLAITPDQAPVANFTVTSAPPGQVTRFDASSSTVAYGTIASYVWNFGDGSPVVMTSTPTTTHVYATTGSYTASVTETSSAGTSLPATTLSTGRTLLREGSASAEASRSVVIAPAQPVVTLSASSLSYPTLGVGQASAPQTLTLTNTGDAPLLVSGVALGGGDPGDYAVTGDSCDAQTVAVGASCSAVLTFTPTAGGSRDANIAFTDNASGSPQTIALNGTGETTGTVEGTVVDGTQTGDPPVAGAQVQICPRGTLGVLACQYGDTNAQGGYTFGNLQPGNWAMQVAPPTANLFGASAIVAVVAGPNAQDFTLTAPQPLPSDFTITGPAGQYSGGIPTMYWNAPFTMVYPAKFATQPANTEAVYLTSVALYNAGDDSPNAEPITSGSAILLVSYDSSGTPSVIGQYPDPAGGVNPTISVSSTSASSARARTVAARDVGGPVARAADCDEDEDPDCNDHHHDDDDDPDWMDDTPDHVNIEDPGYDPLMANIFNDDLPVFMNAQVPSINQQDHGAVNVQVNQNNLRVPPGTTITIKPNGDIVIQTPPTPTCNGVLPCPAQPPQQPCKTSCQPLGPNGGGSSSNGSADYDPSGLVESTKGIPVADAKVTLLRSSVNAGPFAAVPNGSVTMSAGNRRNPDQTTALGLFGWDVVAGFYRVSAQHPGCTATTHKAAALTPIYTVPPPVDNIVLKLSCPHVRRVASQTTLRAVSIEDGTAISLTATVHGSGHRPAGLVTFFAAGTTLRTLPISPVTGRAVWVVPANLAKAFTARYQGDGYHTPSGARARASK